MQFDPVPEVARAAGRQRLRGGNAHVAVGGDVEGLSDLARAAPSTVSGERSIDVMNRPAVQPAQVRRLPDHERTIWPRKCRR